MNSFRRALELILKVWYSDWNSMKKRKKFKPKSGQIDFSKVRWVPVINCVVKYHSKILIVKRDPSMRLYPGYWNGISGFLDDDISLEEKVQQELKEETGISKKEILSIKLGNIFNQEERKYKKTWIVHPVLVRVNTEKVKLDWEAVQYKWINPQEAKKLKLLPGFKRVLKALSLIK